MLSVFDKLWLGSGHCIGQTWTRRKMHYDKYDKIDSLEQSLLTYVMIIRK